MSISKTKSPRRNHKRWSKSADAKLRRLVRKGLNSEELALELGRSRASVITRKSFLKIEKRMKGARGSGMPRVSYHKKNPELPAEAPVLNSRVLSLGKKVDDLISTAKNEGLKVKVLITSD